MARDSDELHTERQPGINTHVLVGMAKPRKADA